MTKTNFILALLLGLTSLATQAMTCKIGIDDVCSATGECSALKEVIINFANKQEQ